MINLNIVAENWADVSAQLNGLFCGIDKANYDELSRNYESACEEIQNLREQLAKADKEIALARKKCAAQAEKLDGLTQLLHGK